MRRLLVVYNPHSSRYVHVRKEVLEPATHLKGYMVGKFAIKKAPFEENVKELRGILKDDDIVIAAGGDATAAVVVNAILEARKDVVLGVLPYGNFNDLARSVNSTRGLPSLLSVDKLAKPLYPLEVLVDGRRWRYATCYVTIGMTAEAVEIFDQPRVRKNLQKGYGNSWRSYVSLARWYFRNRHGKTFLPDFKLNGKEVEPKASDYFAVSGKSVSGIMKGGDDFLKPEVFRSGVCKLTNFWKLMRFMVQSIMKRVPGSETRDDKLEFVVPSTVEVQAEGEYKKFEGVKEIEIRKIERPIRVICG